MRGGRPLRQLRSRRRRRLPGGLSRRDAQSSQRAGAAVAAEIDSYYQRWLQYRATNNQDEVRSMENRMYSIMDNYRIPRDVPFGAVASSGVAGNNGSYGRGGYGRGDNDADDRGGYYGNGHFRNGYHNVLAPEWQQKFDSYYQRWLQYRATNNQDEMRSMENRMRDIMTHYNIPPDVPFGEVASQNIGGGYYRR